MKISRYHFTDIFTRQMRNWETSSGSRHTRTYRK